MSAGFDIFETGNFVAELREAGERAGIDNVVARFIATTELRRMETFGDDYTPFEDEDWPGATEEELSDARDAITAGDHDAA